MELQIRSLTKTYENGYTAVKQLDLTISKGLFGLLGPNGAGKTTLMSILATLLPPTDGVVRFGELQLGPDNPMIRRILGYLPQSFGLYPTLTGKEFLHYIAKLKQIHSFQERKRQVEELLEQVNLADKQNKAIRTYSGGMKQRLGIAQALLGSPQAIIVDEPTAGLDPEERLRFRQLLTELSRNRAVLLSTHIVSDIESSCSRMAVMKAGELLFCGAPTELMKQTEGSLWTCSLTTRQYDGLAFELRSRITNKRVTDNGFEITVLSPEPPLPEAIPARPGLEDAYMALLIGRS